ncbi:MAG TPA: hypothetical protein VJC16_06800 [Candidatus Nanoarchaeia archaeon]|nr:hypothetical protein [Candidatus Nanoarchaeia archaeon]
MGRKIKPRIREEPQPQQEMDFSTDAITRAVRSEINQNPVTVYSGVAALASALYMLVVSFTPSSFLAFTGTLLVCAGSYIFNRFFRGDAIEYRHIERMRGYMKRQSELIIQRVQWDLDKLGCPEGVGQIDLLKEKFESLVSVIQRKIPAGGLAHSRFLGMAEQVYKNILDNLQQVAACLDSISPIDAGDIKRKLGELESQKQRSPAREKQIGQLQMTLQMREERIREINDLLEKNTAAMAHLDQTAASIAGMDNMGEGRQAAVNMEVALEELGRLQKIFQKGKGASILD